MKTVRVLLTLTGLLFVLYCCVHRSPATGALTYTGTDKCQSCHQQQFALFRGSDHYHAMDTVSAETVRGDFNNTSFIYHGDTAFFYKKGSQYCVRTTDSTGIKKEFIIRYTFGWNPLQQYLVPFEDGRLQVLPFCWDTREKEKGGQRWFHLYGKEKIMPGDELFWTGINQNWNYMCADCHTTDFKKNYSAAEDAFLSTWKESRVSCESCHGPASGHMEWAEKKDASLPFKGFAISLAAKAVNWKPDPVRQTLQPDRIQLHDTLMETCARCHARATRFSDAYQHGQSLLQTHLPENTGPLNYYIDGQIKEEDYEYGSFLQSKMYAKGVTCITCHEPHSMKTRVTGNALCTSCHQPAKYDGPQHSFHKTTGTGNQCVGCHMPVTTYMGVDDRRDHSIRIPRPDHSVLMGTPNACNKCHTDKSLPWAAEHFTRWYKDKLPKEKTYPELLYAISRYVKESEPSLYEILQHKNYPAIIRATAMEQYGYYTTSRVFAIILEELQSKDPLLRLNALKALRNYPPANSRAHVLPLLADKVAGVRQEAMMVLAPQYSQLNESDRKLFSVVQEEYNAVQTQMSHRPEGYFNRAVIKNFTGAVQEAEHLYRLCVQLYPRFIPAWSNLADLYRDQGREEEARQVIAEGLREHPGSGYLHYSLGLWYIRKKDTGRGVDALRKAATADPGNAQFTYGYAIALFSTSRQAEALKLLEQFQRRYGNQPLVLDGLISVSRDLNLAEKAARYETLRREVFGY